ncbi:MAG: carbohydrate-binding family 9-like protein [Chitinophagaceae bacterium]
MKEIKVKNISNSIENNSIDKIANLLDTFEKQVLEYVPWPEFSDKPKVVFTIAHNQSNIFLKYYVEEKNIRAENKIANSPVHEDSCVEFFISFNEDISYYNIEFNCIGTGLIAYGPSKYNRQLLESDMVNNLKKKSVIVSENANATNWELTLVIPLSTFVHTSFQNLEDITCRANFYKCGDLLPEPHFISWSNIISSHPNFHLPQFFGKLVFE